MKKFMILLFCSAVIFSTKAQLLKNVIPVNTSFNDSLNRIVNAYLNNYRHIQGKIFQEQSDVDIYYSTQSVPGASEALIYRFHSVEDSTASWQAVMYNGDNFEEAAKVYKNIYRLVNKSRLNFGEVKAGSFKGTYTGPTEDLRFTSSILYSQVESGPYKYFIANIDLLNNFGNWEVRLSLNKKKDDREKY